MSRERDIEVDEEKRPIKGEPGKKSSPHEDKPDGKDFGADDDTPQQGGL